MPVLYSELLYTLPSCIKFCAGLIIVACSIVIHVLFLTDTGRICPILEMCTFCNWQFSVFGHHVFNISVQNSVYSKNYATLTLYSVVKETEDKSWILESCKFHFYIDYIHC